MLVSSARSIIIRSSVFCVFCSLVMCVVDAMGDHIVISYSSIGLVTALYVESNVLLSLPHLVEEGTYLYSFGCFGCRVV